MRSVMFVGLTAGRSISPPAPPPLLLLLLLVSSVTGEEGTEQDASLVPTWSRKLAETQMQLCSDLISHRRNQGPEH